MAEGSVDGPILVTVRLWIAPGGREAFRRFEAAAFAAMARYGASAPDVAAGGDGADETHRIRFPSRAAFDAYRLDEGLTKLAPLRATAIARTEVTVAPA